MTSMLRRKSLINWRMLPACLLSEHILIHLSCLVPSGLLIVVHRGIVVCSCLVTFVSDVFTFSFAVADVHFTAFRCAWLLDVGTDYVIFIATDFSCQSMTCCGILALLYHTKQSIHTVEWGIVESDVYRGVRLYVRWHILLGTFIIVDYVNFVTKCLTKLSVIVTAVCFVCLIGDPIFGSSWPSCGVPF